MNFILSCISPAAVDNSIANLLTAAGPFAVLTVAVDLGGGQRLTLLLQPAPPTSPGVFVDGGMGIISYRREMPFVVLFATLDTPSKSDVLPAGMSFTTTLELSCAMVQQPLPGDTLILQKKPGQGSHTLPMGNVTTTAFSNSSELGSALSNMFFDSDLCDAWAELLCSAIVPRLEEEEGMAAGSLYTPAASTNATAAQFDLNVNIFATEVSRRFGIPYRSQLVAVRMSGGEFTTSNNTPWTTSFVAQRLTSALEATLQIFMTSSSQVSSATTQFTASVVPVRGTTQNDVASTEEAPLAFANKYLPVVEEEFLGTNDWVSERIYERAVQKILGGPGNTIWSAASLKTRLKTTSGEGDGQWPPSIYGYSVQYSWMRECAIGCLWTMIAPRLQCGLHVTIQDSGDLGVYAFFNATLDRKRSQWSTFIMFQSFTAPSGVEVTPQVSGFGSFGASTPGVSTVHVTGMMVTESMKSSFLAQLVVPFNAMTRSWAQLLDRNGLQFKGAGDFEEVDYSPWNDWKFMGIGEAEWEGPGSAIFFPGGLGMVAPSAESATARSWLNEYWFAFTPVDSSTSSQMRLNFVSNGSSQITDEKITGAVDDYKLPIPWDVDATETEQTLFEAIFVWPVTLFWDLIVDLIGNAMLPDGPEDKIYVGAAANWQWQSVFPIGQPQVNEVTTDVGFSDEYNWAIAFWNSIRSQVQSKLTPSVEGLAGRLVGPFMQALTSAPTFQGFNFGAASMTVFGLNSSPYVDVMVTIPVGTVLPGGLTSSIFPIGAWPVSTGFDLVSKRVPRPAKFQLDVAISPLGTVDIPIVGKCNYIRTLLFSGKVREVQFHVANIRGFRPASSGSQRGLVVLTYEHGALAEKCTFQLPEPGAYARLRWWIRFYAEDKHLDPDSVTWYFGVPIDVWWEVSVGNDPLGDAIDYLVPVISVQSETSLSEDRVSVGTTATLLAAASAGHCRRTVSGFLEKGGTLTANITLFDKDIPISYSAWSSTKDLGSLSQSFGVTLRAETHSQCLPVDSAYYWVVNLPRQPPASLIASSAPEVWKWNPSHLARKMKIAKDLVLAGERISTQPHSKTNIKRTMTRRRSRWGRSR